jgi:hypothetical protein
MEGDGEREIRQDYFQTPGHVAAAASVLPLIDIIAVSARFWIRRRHKQSLSADDWFMVPALLFTLTIAALILYGVAHESLAVTTKFPPGFAGNPVALDSDQIRVMNKIQFTFTILIPLALGCTKASFICFYLRIFSVNKRSTTHYVLVGVLSFVILWMTTFFFTELFQCRFNFWAVNGSALSLITHCPDTSLIDISICSSDAATDILVIALPIPLIWRLNMSRSKKIAICGVFLLGAVTLVASLLRLAETVRLATVGFSPDEDGVLVVTSFLYWGIVECSVAVFAACLPTLHIMFRGWSWDTLKSSIGGIFSSPSYDSFGDKTPVMQLSAAPGSSSSHQVAVEKGDPEFNSSRPHPANAGTFLVTATTTTSVLESRASG